MIIVTEHSENILVTWYENTHFGIEDEHPPRALYVKPFEGLYDEEKSINAELMEQLTEMVNRDDVRVYRCYDDSLFIVGIDKSSMQVAEAYRMFMLDYGLRPSEVILFTMGENWDRLRVISTEKQKVAQEIAKRESRKRHADEKEKGREAALNQKLSEELLSTLQTRRQNRKTLEVLVVEDDAFSLTLVNRSLRPQYQVASAADAYDAIATYVLRAPDVLFLDIDLPDATGHEVLHKILSIDPEAYVVMLSGNGDRDNVLSAMQNGAKGFVGKPFAQEKLVHYIELATKQKQAS